MRTFFSSHTYYLTRKTSYRYIVRTGRKRPSYNKNSALQVDPGAKSYNYVIDLESDEKQRSANVAGNGDYSGTDYTTTLLKNKKGTLSEAYKGTKSRDNGEINNKKENDKQEKQVKKETHTKTGEVNKIRKNDKQGEKRTNNTRERKSTVPKNTEIKEMTKKESSKKGGAPGEHYQESEKNPKENIIKKTQNQEQVKEKRGKDGQEDIRRGVRSDAQLSCTVTRFQKCSQSGKNGSEHPMLSISFLDGS